MPQVDNLVANTKFQFMDRIVTATEANQRFSELLREVSAGDTITITSHGKPVAEMAPPKPKKRLTKEEMKAFWERMDALPRIVTGPWTRDELYDR